MSNAVTETAAKVDMLMAGHRKRFGDLLETLDYAGAEVVSTFGAPQAEYAAIRKATGLVDARQRGVLKVSGKDRHAFLNNFLTNLTWSKETKKGMDSGTGVYAFLLNGKGRIVADMNVLEVAGEGGADGAVYLETDERLVGGLRSSLEKYVFTEKVTFEVPALRVLSLHGPLGLEVLQEQGAVVGELAALGSRRVVVCGVACVVFRDDACGVPGHHLIVPEAKAGEVWVGLVGPYEAQQNKRTLRPVGWAMFNACRIEAGRPLYGVDFTDQSLPAEVGEKEFARGLSVVKGCYLGQEIVARMYARQVVAKQIVGLKMTTDALPVAGAELLTEDNAAVGGVTSSTLSPVMGGAAIALGTVKKGYWAEGTKLKVAAEGKIAEAVIVKLPFVTP